jgi:hypothetical protein
MGIATLDQRSARVTRGLVRNADPHGCARHAAAVEPRGAPEVLTEGIRSACLVLGCRRVGALSVRAAVEQHEALSLAWGAGLPGKLPALAGLGAGRPHAPIHAVDGRPDIITHGPYVDSASINCGSQYSYSVYGPTLLAHSLPPYARQGRSSQTDVHHDAARTAGHARARMDHARDAGLAIRAVIVAGAFDRGPVVATRRGQCDSDVCTARRDPTALGVGVARAGREELAAGFGHDGRVSISSIAWCVDLPVTVWHRNVNGRIGADSVASCATRCAACAD